MRSLNQVYLRGVLPLTDRDSCRRLSHGFHHYESLEGHSLATNSKRQWEALRKLLSYAYDKSAFYRRRFEDIGLRPNAIASPADLEPIPPLTRDDIRDHLDELQSSDFALPHLRHAATGGTTDSPVAILRSAESVRQKVAIQWRFNSWAGFLPGDKVFYLWGARQDYAENPSWRWKLYDRHLMRRVWAPTSRLNEDVFESYRLILNRLRPRLIYAYPTPLALFCEYLEASNLPYHRPAAIICTAEPLLDHQRSLIERVMGSSPFEQYGSREFGMIAGECEFHQGLHINPAAAYVEYLPVEGADVHGLHELLVTDLLNYGMPLIRYRVNDCVQLASTSACPCGRGYPRVARIIGRTTDVFYLPNGDAVPGVALTNRVLKVCPGLKKLQVIQERHDFFRVRYVPGHCFTTDDLRILKTKLENFLGSDVRCVFEQVHEIERERSGKTRFCISRVGRPAGSAPAKELLARL